MLAAAPHSSVSICECAADLKQRILRHAQQTPHTGSLSADVGRRNRIGTPTNRLYTIKIALEAQLNDVHHLNAPNYNKYAVKIEINADSRYNISTRHFDNIE